MTKQIITVEISCNEKCPDEIPNSCLHCEKYKNGKAVLDIIEVLEDLRYENELPPIIKDENDIKEK